MDRDNKDTLKVFRSFVLIRALTGGVGRKRRISTCDGVDQAGLDARPRVAPLDALQHDIGTVWSEVMLMKQCFR